MKIKKVLFTSIVLIVAVIAMIVYGIITNIAEEPTIAQKDFPFSITYELDGKIETVEGVYSVAYVGNGGYVETTKRLYEGTFICQQEDFHTYNVLKEDEAGDIYLYTNFYADYMMGDSEKDYFAELEFRPVIEYGDREGNIYSDEKTLMEHGVRLIAWEYPEPIENTLVFSHISYMSGAVVIPFALISLGALLIIILFVKREKGLEKSRLDIVTILLNIAIGVVEVPFTIVYGILSDINGSSPAFSHQMGYLMSPIAILGLAASVGLRRKGYSKESFLVQWVGPVAFVLLVICLFIVEYIL